MFCSVHGDRGERRDQETFHRSRKRVRSSLPSVSHVDLAWSIDVLPCGEGDAQGNTIDRLLIANNTLVSPTTASLVQANRRAVRHAAPHRLRHVKAACG